MKGIRIVISGLSLVLSFHCFFVNAQIIQDFQVNEALVKKWTVEDKSLYEGVYSFGISECESELYLAIDGSLQCVQIKDYTWSQIDSAHSDWTVRYRNFTNVQIVGNKFLCDETNGEFVEYFLNGKQIHGLKLERPYNCGGSGYEIGVFNIGNKLGHLDGDFAQTKFDLIPNEALESFSKAELQIMRNEIFARYGYKFIKGGEMRRYFNTKRWYSPRDINVADLLTPIEKENIRRITIAESKKD